VAMILTAATTLVKRKVLMGRIGYLPERVSARAVRERLHPDRRPSAVWPEALVDLWEITKLLSMCVTFSSTLHIVLIRVTADSAIG
jgi:hypothetical protein